jgi:hypothetical protein
MDEFTIYLDKTNKAQFCKWLSVYCKKKQVESKQYPYLNGQVYNFYYPFNISPDFQSQLVISANFTKIVEANEAEEKYLMELWDLENAVKISWLEIGERMKIIIAHDVGKWTVYPVFDLLAEIGKDWLKIQKEVWNYIQAQAGKYHIELPGQPFPIDLPEAQPAPVDAAPVGAGKTEMPKRKKLLNQACIEWASRESDGRLGRYTREDFLLDFEERTGELITKDEFSRALEDAQERGKVENVKGRLKKTRP